MDKEITAVRIGVSACLLGQRVRFDGGHKHTPCITDTLGELFTLVGVCPEVGCGLSTPRDAMRLEGDSAAPRLVVIRTGEDLTEQMLAYCREKVVELEKEDLCGFIFKRNSPSSGLNNVTVYDGGIPAGFGRGLFADAVVRRLPLLPVVEAESLSDASLREEFIERVLAYRKKQIRRTGCCGALLTPASQPAP